MKNKSLYLAIVGLLFVLALLLLMADSVRDRSRNGTEDTPSVDRNRLAVESLDEQLDTLSQVDEALILYREVRPLKPTGLESLSAIAVGPRDDIYAGGGRQIVALSAAGEEQRRWTLDAEVTCVSVAQNGMLYVGLGDAVAKVDTDGDSASLVEGIPAGAIVTSLATPGDHLFVADAGNRVVLHFASDGQRVGTIDGKKADADAPGFVVPSPYFDVVLGQGRTLWIVNPGRHRLEEYSFDGDLIGHWERDGGMGLENFCGCCNPSHAARLSDGSLVTSETGLARVKLYTRRGGFVGVVAAPRQFSDHAKAMDLAVDSRDRVLVADPGRGEIRIFEPKTSGKE